MSQEGAMEEPSVRWGKAFTWKIRGAGVEKVWAITGDFLRVDKWVTTLVQSCELVDGQPQQPGCVRRPVLYPAAPGQPFTFGLEKLLLMDPLSHYYQYAIIGGTLPGFSLMQDYVSSVKLSSLTSFTPPPNNEHHNSSPHATPCDDNSTHVSSITITTNTINIPSLEHSCHDASEEDATLLHWSFTCHPVSTLSEQDAHQIAFSLYEIAVADLRKHLALEENSITLLD